MHDPTPYRSLFPHISQGIIYLNHAAISPFSTTVADRLQYYIEDRSSATTDDFDAFFNISDSLKSKISTLLNTTADRLAFVDCTSTGLNILANGLRWKSGDRVLLNTLEFPSNVYPFMNLKRLGVEVDFVNADDNTVPVGRLIEAVTPRTRLLSISHVQFVNGYCADLAALGNFCRDRNIIFSVDAIQSAGVVPIDVEAMKIDFLATGAHKWLMAPEGNGFIYITEELQGQIRQAYVGWTSIVDYFERLRDLNIELDPTARRFEIGTLNTAGIFGLDASLGLLLEVGIGAIREHILDLTDGLIGQLKERDIQCITPENRNERGGIVSFKPADTDALIALMKKRKIHTALRGGYVRVAPHFYNTREEMDAIVECIDESSRAYA
jgi:cysteine desulfurase / selenocysteine lyase